MRPLRPTLRVVDEFEALLVVGHGELPGVVPPSPRWQRWAACAGMDVNGFYPEREGSKGAIAAARLVCGGCPVQRQCLAWALDHDELGVWAGTTENQRRTMKRQAA